jgi:hypothetical protein
MEGAAEHTGRIGPQILIADRMDGQNRLIEPTTDVAAPIVEVLADLRIGRAQTVAATVQSHNGLIEAAGPLKGDGNRHVTRVAHEIERRPGATAQPRDAGQGKSRHRVP